MAQQIPIDPASVAATEVDDGALEAAPDVAYWQLCQLSCHTDSAIGFHPGTAARLFAGDGEHECRATEKAKFMAGSRDVLVVARAETEKILQLVMTSTEPGG